MRKFKNKATNTILSKLKVLQQHTLNYALMQG